MRTRTAHFRVSEDEDDLIGKTAAAAGVPRSEWIRDTLREATLMGRAEVRVTEAIREIGERILLTLEAWQRGGDLSDPEVKARVNRLAKEAARR